MALSGVFIGEGTLLVRCAEVFVDAGQRVPVVVSSNRVIRDWADDRQIPHVTADADLVPLLVAAPPDYLFSVANTAIIKEEVLRLPRQMAINFHDALLPRYAGVHATSWALINRETSHGVTWHEMLASADRGRILKQRAFEIAPGETAVSLNARCYEAGIESFAELVDDLSTDRLMPCEQQFEERMYFASEKRPRAACTISWDRPAEDTAALIAALMFGPTDNPLGLPKVELGVGTVLACEGSVLHTRSDAAPGTVIGIDREVVQVATTTYDLALGGFQTLDGQPLPFMSSPSASKSALARACHV